MLPAFFLGMYEFLSAPSARRATSTRWLIRDPTTNFYPRPPRGGRLLASCQEHMGRTISIHALREEGDRCNYGPPCGGSYFYPRPPRGGRHRHWARPCLIEEISIHALREEGDQPGRGFLHQRCNFYPHPLRGGRRTGFCPVFVRRIFLSTPSARRATAKTERKYSAFVSLYTSLHKLQRGLCKASRKITPLLA